MRKPHPRFDARRNAWVTNAGGKLKILAAGPKNAQTEAAAQTEFYEHMYRLGRPLKQARPAISLGKLADQYDGWMQQEVAQGRMKPATRAYYVRFIQAFLDAVGGKRPAHSVLPLELERFKTSWHRSDRSASLQLGRSYGAAPQEPVQESGETDAGCSSTSSLSGRNCEAFASGGRAFPAILVGNVPHHCQAAGDSSTPMEAPSNVAGPDVRAYGF